MPYEHISCDWKQIYQSPFIVARETALQSFQYKIINRYLPCNTALKKWKKTESELCNQCGERDTIEHYLYECDIFFFFLKLII